MNNLCLFHVKHWTLLSLQHLKTVKVRRGNHSDEKLMRTCDEGSEADVTTF